MIFYFITLINLIQVFLFPHCQNGQNNCMICNPVTNICTKCSLDIYTPNENGGCSPISKCTLGKNYCLKCDELGKNCASCETGLYPDENGGCSFVNNCEVSYRGFCHKCKQDFILIGAICKSLFLEDFANCEKINNVTGLCDKCKESYFLNSGDKRCSDIEHCYESSFGKCTSCERGYYLDIKSGGICKKTDAEVNDLLFCKETLDGKKCDICEDGYFFDQKGNCVGINYCAERKEYLCDKCIENYYFNKYRDTCVNDPNCSLGDRVLGLCRRCNIDFYLDLNDGKCKPNQDDNNFKNCDKVENNLCVSCDFPNYLSEDGKCVNTKNCSEVEDGICLSCIEGYYLGLDNRCIDVENCIYSETYYECKECKEGFYFNRTIKQCLKSKIGYENCRITSYNGDYCAFCKSGFYMNQTDHLCYDNNEKNDLYKCSVLDLTGNYCNKCEDKYHIGSKDKKCTNIEYCEKSENGEKCLQCDEWHCLDVKNGKCEINNKIISEEKKFLYKCMETDLDGSSCEKCNDGYILKINFCFDDIHCIEKDEEGNCIKCKNDNEYISCFNSFFGCVSNIDTKCIECNDINNFDKCTKCEEGYEIDENYKCTKSKIN